MVRTILQKLQCQPENPHPRCQDVSAVCQKPACLSRSALPRPAPRDPLSAALFPQWHPQYQRLAEGLPLLQGFPEFLVSIRVSALSHYEKQCWKCWEEFWEASWRWTCLPVISPSLNSAAPLGRPCVPTVSLDKGETPRQRPGTFLRTAG